MIGSPLLETLTLGCLLDSWPLPQHTERPSWYIKMKGLLKRGKTQRRQKAERKREKHVRSFVKKELLH